jgi:ACS family glucarate transporter-like MFS transporter
MPVAGLASDPRIIGPFSKRRSGIVVLMVLLSVMTYFDRTIITIAGPGIMKEFSLSETEMGAVYSAYLLTYALLMVPGGLLADLLGPRRVLTFMALGSAVFTGLTALAGRPGLGAYMGVIPSFLMIRLALGVCAAPEYPSSGRMNANWTPASERARIWGWIASGAGIGGAISPLLFTWMSARYGWRGAFCISAVASAILGAVWYWYARDYPYGRQSAPTARSVQERRRTPWKQLLTNRDLMLLTAGYVTVAYFEYIFFYWLYYYFGQIRHMGMNQSVVYTTLMWLAWFVMTPIGGWVSDRAAARYGPRVGRRLVPIVGLTLSAILLYIGTNLTDTVSVVTLLCLSLGFAASSDGPYWAAAIDAGGEHSGVSGAILNTGGNLGGLLAPVLTPFIASKAGWSWGLYAGSLIVMIGVALWFFIGTSERVPAEAPREAQ